MPQLNYEFTCKNCGSHRFYVDANEQLLSIRYCLDCQMSTEESSPDAIEAEIVNHNEITSIGAIAAAYLVGRKMALGGKVYEINAVYPTTGSRMAMTIVCQGGPTKRVYLPSRIELMPEGWE